jgi:hypothetical protein
LFCTAGAGEDSSASNSAKQHWSWESYFLEHLGGGWKPSDIQGQLMAYPKAGEGTRRINLLCEALIEVCSRILRLLRGKWFCPRL